MNCKAGRAGLQFYVLIRLLHQESKTVTLQLKLVKASKCARYQRKRYRVLQGKILSLWDKYNNGTLKTSALLTACSHLHDPVRA